MKLSNGINRYKFLLFQSLILIQMNHVNAQLVNSLADTMKVRNMFSEIHGSSQLLSQYSDNDSYATDGMYTIVHNRLNYCIKGVPLGTEFYFYEDKNSKRAGVTGFQLSFDRKKWITNLSKKSKKELVKKGIKLPGYQSAIDSLGKYDALSRTLNDTAIKMEYSRARKELYSLEKNDSITKSGDVVRSRIALLKKNISRYDSLKSEYQKYYHWRKQTLNKYSHDLHFNEELKQYRKGEINENSLDKINLSRTEKILSHFNELSIGMAVLNESKLTLQNYTFSGIQSELVFGNISIGTKYGFKPNYISAISNSMFHLYNFNQGDYQRLRSVSVQYKASEKSLQQIELLHFLASDQINTTGSDYSSSKEAYILYFKSSSQISRNLKYLFETASNQPVQTEVHQEYADHLSSRFEIIDEIPSLGNQFSLMFEKSGSKYFTPGNRYQTQARESYGAKVKQVLFASRMNIGGGWAKTSYGLSNNSSSFSQYQFNASASYNITRSILTDYQYTNFNLYNETSADFGQNRIQKSENHQVNLNVFSSIIFRKENTSISVSRNKTWNYQAETNYFVSNLNLSENISIDQKRLLTLGFNLINNKTPTINSNQKSFRASISNPFLKKGIIRLGAQQMYQSSGVKMTDFNLQMSYKMNKNINMTLALLNRYYYRYTITSYDENSINIQVGVGANF